MDGLHALFGMKGFLKITFLLLDATDKSKISSDRNWIQFGRSANTPFHVSQTLPSRSPQKTQTSFLLTTPKSSKLRAKQSQTKIMSKQLNNLILLIIFIANISRYSHLLIFIGANGFHIWSLAWKFRKWTMSSGL